MSIAEKLVKATSLVDEVYKAGQFSREKFHLSLYHISLKDFQWNAVNFPENYDFYLRLAKTPNTCNGLLFNATGVKTATLSCDDKSGTVNLSQAFRDCPVEIVDLSDFNCKIKDFPYFVYNANNLVTILGALDLSYCSNANSAFTSARKLENLEFERDSIVLDLNFTHCEKLSHNSLLYILDGLRNQNINIDIKNYVPDFASDKGNFTPGTYKIKEVSIDPYINSSIFRYANLTTENGYHIRVAQQDCANNWTSVLNGFMVGNYLEIDGAINSNGDYEFETVRLVSNPSGATRTLTLGTTNLNKLTEEEKQIATNKGWVLK